MATVSKLSDAARLRNRQARVLPDGLPLPQAPLGALPVRGLLRTGEVLRMSKTWSDPARLADVADRLHQTEEDLLTSLPTSVWYGAFRLRRKIRLDKRLHYEVTCVCGGEYILTTAQLAESLLNHTGCRHDCCQQRVLLQMFWGTLTDSLWIQWRLLQACHPKSLPSYWGGTLDDVYERDMQYGFVRAYQEALKYMVDLQHPDRRWITPLNPELPFTRDNLQLADMPWAPVAKLNKLAIVIAEQPVPITELCESLNVSIAQALDALVTDGVSPDDLVAALMQKGVTA